MKLSIKFLSLLILILLINLNIKAEKEFLPLQPGDVPDTYADVADLVTDLGYKPKVNLEEGVKEFVDWYTAFYDC